MTSTLKLSKLHATGNDFLVVAALDGPAPVDAALARALCDRRTGVGADGVLTLSAAPIGSLADCRMTLHNADGGTAEMSGNGIRCLAAVAARHGLGTHEELVVETGAGSRGLLLHRDPSGAVVWAEVDMGSASFEPTAIPVLADTPFDLVIHVDGLELRGDAISMGNPHLVVPVADPDTVPLERIGPVLEWDPRFPQRTNVEVVGPAGPSTLRMRVWERGVGETRSCGTGACAVAVAAHRRGLVGDEVQVLVPGGALSIRVGPTVRLGGPVVHVAEIEVSLAALGGTAW